MKTPTIDIREILRHYDLHPDKRLGQVFLLDNRHLKRIVEIAQITLQDNILEIGPGLGSLTQHLAQQARLVVAVEVDARLISPLEKILAPYPNVRIVQGDILRLHPSELLDKEEYLVVANIPYYITSQVIRHLLEAEIKPRKIVLTIQQEVAERICALPGEMSLLALSVQVFGQPILEHTIPAKAFYPQPKVDSAVVSVELYQEPLIPTDQLNTFFMLAKAGFSQRRKMLRNSISAGMAIDSKSSAEIISSANIDPVRRAETLSLDEWHMLTSSYLKYIPKAG